MIDRYEAVVVGMGPAGTAAALELAGAGARTALIDQAGSPGGQVYRRPHAGGLAPSRRRRGERLIRRLDGIGPALTLFQGATVWGAFAPGSLNLHREGRLLEIGYERLLICEGAQERIVPCLGWTLPGVFGLGGLQKMIGNQGIAPRGRVLLAGSGPLMPAAGAALASAGARLAGWYEAAPLSDWLGVGGAMLQWPRLVRESMSYLSALLRGGVTPRFGWGLQALSGDDRVREATLVRLGPSGNPLPGSERKLPVDAVGIGFGLQPAARLARLAGCRMRYDPERRYFAPDSGRWGESSSPGVYVAGDGAGIGGADWSEIRGRLAGLHAAWSLGRIDTRKLEKESRTLRLSEGKIASYLRRFHRVFTPRDGHYRAITPETTVCRCEGVRAGDLTARIRAGDRDLTLLKPTRLGMGPCQGRGCEGIAAELLRREGVAPAFLEPLNLRPPLSPLPLSLFGHE